MLDTREKEILKLLPSDQTVLDIGCAQNPQLHIHIAKKSLNATGIDINTKGVRLLNRKGFKSHVMNTEHISLTTKFDFIVAGELIEHLNNPGLFIESMIKHLKTNGKIILTTPNVSSILLYILVVFFDKTQDSTHVYYFDLKNLQSLIDRFGLRMKSYSYVPPEIKLHGKGFIFRSMFLLATVIANVGFVFSKRLFGSYIITVLEKNK